MKHENECSEANPQIPVISISQSAIEAAIKLRKQNPEWTNLGIRLYLAGKGCDGFDYGVTFDQFTNDDLVINISSDLDVGVDTATLQFVSGSFIDWVDDHRGRGFLVQNPNHKKFRGKFFKRKVWQDRLLGTPHS